MKIHDLHDSDRVNERHPIYGQLAEETAALEVLIMLNQFFNSYETSVTAAPDATAALPDANAAAPDAISRSATDPDALHWYRPVALLGYSPVRRSEIENAARSRAGS